MILRDFFVSSLNGKCGCISFFPFCNLYIAFAYMCLSIQRHIHGLKFCSETDFLLSMTFFLEPEGRAWQSSTFICPLVLNWQFLLCVQELLKVIVSAWTSSAACHTLPSWWSVWRDLAQNKGSFALKTCHLARSHLSGGVSSKSAANTRTAKLSLKSVASLMISTKWG